MAGARFMALLPAARAFAPARCFAAQKSIKPASAGAAAAAVTVGRPAFAVVRQDDHGTQAVMATAATRKAADAIVAEYEERGHKQTYSVVELDPGVVVVPGDELR